MELRNYIHTVGLGGIMIFDSPLIYRPRIMKLNMKLSIIDDVRATKKYNSAT